MKNNEKWMANYEALKAYIDEHHHLPDKHRVEFRGLLSWWKYQMKKKKAGTLTEEQVRMLQELADSRSTEHTGGRRRAHDDDAASPTIRYRYDNDDLFC